MAKRGRPPYPDVLTPREWEVLSLLREGLSNDEIAARLGISLDGVKYHVSEILGKLGLENRHDAARWRPEERRPWALAPLSFWRRLDFGWLGTTVACTLLLLVAGAIGMLAWALVATDGGSSEKTQATAPTPAVTRLEVSRTIPGFQQPNFTLDTPPDVRTRTTTDASAIAAMRAALLALPVDTFTGIRHCPLDLGIVYGVKFIRADGSFSLTAGLNPTGCSLAQLSTGGPRLAPATQPVWQLVADVLGIPLCEITNPPVPGQGSLLCRTLRPGSVWSR